MTEEIDRMRAENFTEHREKSGASLVYRDENGRRVSTEIPVGAELDLAHPAVQEAANRVLAYRFEMAKAKRTEERKRKNARKRARLGVTAQPRTQKWRAISTGQYRRRTRPQTSPTDRDFVPAALKHWRTIHGLSFREAQGRIGYSESSSSWSHWECVPLTSEILTREGWKLVDDIGPLDETLGFDEASQRLAWTPILRVNRFSGAQLVRVGNKHWSTETTLNHRWIVERRGKPAQMIASGDIRDGDRVRLSAPGPAEGGLKLSRHDGELDAYLCGLSPQWAAGAHWTVEPTRVVDVWCPTTGLGSWTMRADGVVLLTGNSGFVAPPYSTLLKIMAATGLGFWTDPEHRAGIDPLLRLDADRNHWAQGMRRRRVKQRAREAEAGIAPFVMAPHTPPGPPEEPFTP